MRRGRKFWEKAVADVTAGATQAAVAERLGVTRAGVQYWVAKLARERAATGLQLLPVRVAVEPPMFLEVQAGDVTLRMPGGVAPTYVAELVRALRSC